MKYSCEVIKDLLPLYCDGVCSEQSSKIVEEHIAQCESCRKMISENQGEFEEKGISNDVASLKYIAKKWKSSKITSFIWGITIAFISVFGLLGISSVVGYYEAGGTYVEPSGLLRENFAYIFVGFWSFILMILGFLSLFIQKAAEKKSNKKSSLIVLIVSGSLFVCVLILSSLGIEFSDRSTFYYIVFGMFSFLVALMSTVSLVINMIYDKYRN